MKVLYQEGIRDTSKVGVIWVQVVRHNSDFHTTGELYPTYILRWEVSGEPVDGWGEYGQESHPTVIGQGRELLDTVVENDAMAIRIAIAKYDRLTKPN